MPCYHPLKAFQSEIDRKIYFGTYSDEIVEYNQLKRIELPCGRCVGCRLEHSRKWAMRCVYEASMHNRNCFLTLTYAPEHLPDNGSLRKRDLTLFFKRLRKAYPDISFRYFACGEYGEQLERPHYHVILFGFTPPDYQGKRLCAPEFGKLSSLFSSYGSLSQLYERLEESLDNDVSVRYSQILTKIWGLGHVAVGDVTFESCAYVARYCLKKINGDAADEHYQGRTPEYVVMSRRPGIAKEWFDKYYREIYFSDTCIVRGKECKPPRYFDNCLKTVDENWYDDIKRDRADYISANPVDNDRLLTMEKIAQLKMQKTSRKFEKNV